MKSSPKKDLDDFMRNEISVKWQALRFGTQPEERAVIETIVFLRRQGCEIQRDREYLECPQPAREERWRMVYVACLADLSKGNRGVE